MGVNLKASLKIPPGLRLAEYGSSRRLFRIDRSTIRTMKIKGWGTRGVKYGSKRVEHSGHSFASKLEAAVFDHYRRLEESGEITDLQCQSRVYLVRDPDIYYIPDFTFKRDGVLTWGEAKGFATDVWKIKKKLWEHFGPGTLEIWEGSYKNPKLSEKLVGGKSVLSR